MNKYEQLSHQRKQLQQDSLAPEWMSTAGFQLLTEQHYLDTGETPSSMYERIAHRAAELTSFEIPSDYGYLSWYEAFFDIMWRGWLSPSTPILTNMGNSKGHPVSCSGTYVGDSIRSFYQARTELAQLTQRGYGTSVCLDPIRSRGSASSKGVTANGVMQFASGVVQDMHDISQGTRRGNCGQYINPLHLDSEEVMDQIISDDDGWNIGWNITDEYNELFSKDPERADYLWQRMLKTKMTKGKGYFFFPDKVNRYLPQMYVDKGFKVRHSNLCAEIALMSDEDHSFTCVLSSMNVSKFNDWKDTKAVEISTVLLDAVISDMLIKAKQEPGFERVISFTEKSRAIGLGQLGMSTYFQQEGWVFGDFQSIQFNMSFTTLLTERALAASRLLASEVGEPEWMEGYGERFSHLTAFPPTKSTAIILGGISEGIAPVFANVFEQDTAGGTVYRINPVLLKLMKERGQYTEEVMKRINDDQGSVQQEPWLSDNEKAIFRTAFEVSQESILLMASQRQKAMTERGQGQSVNLFFTADEKEEEIARLHDIAFKDEYIHSLYYILSLNGVQAVKHEAPSCAACEG